MVREELSEDPEILRELLGALLHFFEQAIELRDCALQVAQTVPDWKSRMREAKDNPLRQQHTQDFLSSVRKIFSVGLGRVSIR